MGNIQKNVKAFAFIGFVLLAVLFGMQIMTFIFGSLGGADYLEDDTITTVNESGAYINITGYSLTKASQADFSGGAVIITVINLTDGALVLSGNYTVNSRTGVLTNASTSDFSTGDYGLNITYTTNHKTEAEMVSDETINQSLRGISDYAGQSGTQFTTLGVAITLILLVAVFLFFWKSFMGRKEQGPGSFQ